MTTIAVVLVAAAIAHGLAQWRRLPAIPFLLVAGLALNASGLIPDHALLDATLQLGLMFLVFVAGIELNPRRVGRQMRAAVKVGLAQFVVMSGVGLGAALYLGASFQVALYLALAIAASSTLLVVRLLRQRQQMFEPFGRLVLGVLLVQDVLIILLMPVLSNLPDGPLAILGGFAGAVALVGGSVVTARWIAPALILRIDLDEERLILVTLALLSLFVAAAIALGLPTPAGAFLAGVALSGFPINGIIRGQIAPLSDFFLAAFLIAMGGSIPFPTADDLGLALILAAFVILVTPPVVILITEAAGLSARSAIEAGLLLAQTSEFSLVVTLYGFTENHLSESVLSVVVIVTLITMFVTPLVATSRMTWRLMRYHPLRVRGAPLEMPRDHVLLIGCGDNGLPLLETLLSSGRQVVAVDDDPAVIAALREGDVPCIRGDGSDFEILRQAGALHAAVIISTMRRPRDSIHLLRFVREAPGVPVLVRVFDETDAKRVGRAGGIPISYADAATEDFLAWLDQAEAVGVDHERRIRPRH